MIRRIALAACTALVGCDLFDTLAGAIGGVTDPLVVLGAVVHVDLPEGIDATVVEGTELAPGTAFFAILGDASVLATTPDDVPAGLAGGQVEVEGVLAADQGDGTYLVVPGALEWRDEETWTVDVEVGGDTATAWVTLPSAADWEAPIAHGTGADLVIDVSGQAFDALLVAVADATTGEITWSNQPATASELLVVARSSGSLVVTVPGAEAFPRDGDWLVGVAATVHTRPDDLAGANTALSSVVAGRMRVFRVPTGSL